ncbi:MAG: hypothetical protein QNJ54_06600 [Prochloraceae cyanobacterium]|nr:hypothetical protein [Prochloraceae cyanobacterium]
MVEEKSLIDSITPTSKRRFAIATSPQLWRWHHCQTHRKNRRRALIAKSDTVDELNEREVKANKIVWLSNVFIGFQVSILS